MAIIVGSGGWQEEEVVEDGKEEGRELLTWCPQLRSLSTGLFCAESAPNQLDAVFANCGMTAIGR